MKITNSSIAMTSTHDKMSYSYKESATLQRRASEDLPGAILEISAKQEGKSYVESMKDFQYQEKRQRDKQQAQNMLEGMKRAQEEQKAHEAENENIWDYAEDDTGEIWMLKRILAILRGEDIPIEDRRHVGKALDLRSRSFKSSECEAAEELNLKLQAGQEVLAGTTRGGTLFQKVTVESGVKTEYEDTTFASVGQVRTADGRSNDFNIEFSMSRAFTEKFNSISVEEMIVCDPLIINLNDNNVTVTDQKYRFDLDADGKEEEISFAGKGSGFLALDKNHDGRINDGTELFGTRSGDGFGDLAAYDEDGNGWIDENDSVYNDLKVWMKDDEGNDRLVSIKKADVGAIYLGSAETQFNLNNEENKTNGVLRKTGVFLHESDGRVGTVSHVDLAL